MVYTRILFNNIKESTPNFFKTIPYSQTVKPVLGRKPQVGWKMIKDPLTIRAMLAFKRYVINNSVNYQIFLFFVTFSVTSAFFYPALWMYQSNNRHRQLDVAIAKEKEYQRKKALEEEEEGEEEEGEGEEAEGSEAKQEDDQEDAKADAEDKEEKADDDNDNNDNNDNNEKDKEDNEEDKDEDTDNSPSQKRDKQDDADDEE